MKSVSHPSLLLELADYNSNPEFNQRYGIVSDGTYLKYVPYASGGSIHINPANRGKFNATKARTGKTTEELTHSKNPLTRKRAIFAQNAAKWSHKHAEGGFLLDVPEYPADEEQTKYARDAKSSYGDTYYDIVNSRYTGAMNALRRKGFSYADAERLAPMIVTQNNLEGGWRLNRADNNFGGMRNNGKTLSFNSVDDFYDAYIDMLDEKWNNGSGYSNSWRYARNLDDWANVLNHEDLNLWSKERWEAYNREHRDSPAYLYAPEWENNGKKYREHLRGVEARTAAYLDMVRKDNPVENWDIQPEETPVQKAAKENPSLLLALINKLRGK